VPFARLQPHDVTGADLLDRSTVALHANARSVSPSAMCTIATRMGWSSA